MKSNSLDKIFLTIILIAFLLLILIRSEEIKGVSYSDLNVIYYDNDETLLHEVCHVVVDNDRQDYFNDNKMQELCKCGE